MDVALDRLRRWLAAHGGSFGERVCLDAQGRSRRRPPRPPRRSSPTGPFGVSVLAPAPRDNTPAAACPLELVITRVSSAHALGALLGPDALDAWSDRQLIASYLAFHHVCPHDALRHLPYVLSLPPAADLLTSLYFSSAERELLRGTNLYGATLDRERDWRADWAQCHALVQSVNPAWADAFTWERYMIASTHISSRAFPSNIFPTVAASTTNSPVLIPGADLLNHKRGQPVSWIVSGPDTDAPSGMFSIVVHPSPCTPDPSSDPEALVELFNNYGPKPNDELILGFGFSIADNPDDIMTLQIGSSTASSSSPPPQKWVIGRDAHNVDDLWFDARQRIVNANGKSEYAFEDDLETAAALSDMVYAKLDGMKTVADVQSCSEIRPKVRVMLEHYITGQKDVLESILKFAGEKQKTAIENARKQGIDLVFDDDESECTM